MAGCSKKYKKTDKDRMSYNQEKMTSAEKRAALSLSAIFASRMLGLFLIFPIFALAAEHLQGYSAGLAGIAIGIYGLTQAIFQIPLGMLSDRIGRKPVIIFGLVIFSIGSVVAALSDNLTGMIIGRALQGTGAIASVVMALAADLTREEHRIKVMALIGMSIGLSFSIAIIASPILYALVGLSGIFWVVALLAGTGILITIYVVPTPVESRFHRDSEVELNWFRHVIADSQLLRLDAGIFILHFMLVSFFIIVPHLLRDQLGLAISQHWQVYLPVFAASVVAMVPFIILAEKKRKLKQVFIGAILLLALSQLGIPLFQGSLVSLMIVIWLFFSAFNLLEAMMPSLVAKLAPTAHKGTAMGAYTTSQFMGIFLGGVIGGSLNAAYGLSGVIAFNVSLALLWAALAITMNKPQFNSSYLLKVGEVSETEAQLLVKRLLAVAGVVEALVIAEDGIAYLKIDKQRINMDDLHQFAVSV